MILYWYRSGGTIMWFICVLKRTACRLWNCEYDIIMWNTCKHVAGQWLVASTVKSALFIHRTLSEAREPTHVRLGLGFNWHSEILFQIHQNLWFLWFRTYTCRLTLNIAKCMLGRSVCVCVCVWNFNSFHPKKINSLREDSSHPTLRKVAVASFLYSLCEKSEVDCEDVWNDVHEEFCTICRTTL